LMMRLNTFGPNPQLAEFINFVCACRDIEVGEVVVEYAGELISVQEARRREALYSADQNTGCYMYYFNHKAESYW